MSTEEARICLLKDMVTQSGYISPGSPEKPNHENTHTCIYTHKHKYTDIHKRRFIIGTIYVIMMAVEVPQSVISKLETQESQQCNSSLSTKA